MTLIYVNSHPYYVNFHPYYVNCFLLNHDSVKLQSKVILILTFKLITFPLTLIYMNSMLEIRLSHYVCCLACLVFNVVWG